MATKQHEIKSFRYTAGGLNLPIVSRGISKTTIRELLRNLPTAHMDRLTNIYFIRGIPEGEREKLYTGRYYHDKGRADIVVYLSSEFLRVMRTKRVFISEARRVILHELGHHIQIRYGIVEVRGGDLEELADRYSERHSNMRVLILVPSSRIKLYDGLIDKFEAAMKLSRQMYT